MIAVLQRVSQAEVEVDGQSVGKIANGWLILLGVAAEDVEIDASWLASKIPAIRAFEDHDGKMNLDVQEVRGSLLVVSQFTLLADCRKGRRPSFFGAASPTQAERLYEMFVTHLKSSGLNVETGRFGADMKVSLINDGPVTLVLTSPPRDRSGIPSA